jgi:hypothetical protein
MYTEPQPFTFAPANAEKAAAPFNPLAKMAKPFGGQRFDYIG